MKELSTLLLAACIAVLPLPPSLAAEPWFGTAMVSIVDDDSERGLDDSQAGYHLGVGRNLSYNWAAELNVVGAGFEDDDEDNALLQWGVGIDLRRRLTGSQHFLPYGLVGAGYLYSDDKRGGPDEDGLMVSLGAGVLSPLPWRNMSLRTEIRVRNDYGGSNFTDYLLSFGVQVPFSLTRVPFARGVGGAEAADGTQSPASGEIGRDADGDGVPDAADMCGGTPAGVAVDDHGCRVRQPEGMYAPGR